MLDQTSLAALAAIVPAATINDDELLETPPGAPPELDLLRTQQRFALEDLTNGKSYTEAARGAGVDRKTLYNWLNKDQAFMAAMEASRRRAMQSADDRLTRSTATAAATLGNAAATDYRAAAILLKGRGLLPGRPDPARENPLATLEMLPPSKRRAFEIRLRELILSFGEESGTDETLSEISPPVMTTPSIQTEIIPRPKPTAAIHPLSPTLQTDVIHRPATPATPDISDGS